MGDDTGDPGTRKVDVKTDGDIITDVLHIGDIQQYFASVERANARTLSAAIDGIPFTGEQEQELMALFVGDMPTIDRVVEAFDRTHLLLLLGERGVGKTTTALHIGGQISMRRRLQRPALLVKALDQNVQVDLRTLPDGKDFNSRITLFADVFEYRNRSLLTSFTRYEGLEWEHLSRKLKDNDAYLIFTACASDVTLFRSRIGRPMVQHELALLDRTLLIEGFDRKVAHIVLKQPDRAARCDVLSQRRAEIVDALETMPRLATFIDDFVCCEDDLSKAVSRFKNVGEWFLGNVNQDFDAWCSSLTLTLAQPTPAANAIPWVDFEILRRAIARQIKTDEELFPVDDSQTRDAAPDAAVRSFDDKPLLDSSRAIIAKDPERLGDVVCFRDGSYADELWKTLLAHHRRILTQLVPALLSMIERENSIARASLRVLAAQMIGRIGEIDPYRVSLPLIRRWASSNDRHQWPLVGRLVQGALASSNNVYRQAALREIAMLTDRDFARDERDARDRLVTAISAYAQIGAYEPRLAMQALGFIAVERLAPAVANIHKVWIKSEAAGIQAEGSAHPRVAQGFHRKRARLTRLAQALNDEQAAAMFALAVAIVQLCLLGDPVSVLQATRDWITRGGFQAGTLLAILFFQDIADDLHARTVTNPGTSERTVVSPLLISLGGSRQAVLNFAAFLIDLRTTIDETSSSYELPVALENELKENFSALLVELSRDAADTAQSDAMVELFAALASARGEILRRELYTLLSTAPFTESDAMRKFAIGARKAVA
jgi:hypothetical protein